MQAGRHLQMLRLFRLQAELRAGLPAFQLAYYLSPSTRYDSHLTHPSFHPSAHPSARPFVCPPTSSQCAAPRARGHVGRAPAVRALGQGGLLLLH